MYMCVYVCVCVCMYMCMHVYVYARMHAHETSLFIFNCAAPATILSHVYPQMFVLNIP